MKHRLLKTLTSLVLVVLMVASLIPTFVISSAAAENTVTINFSGGSGTSQDSWTFTDTDELVSAVAAKGSGSTAPRLDASCMRFYGKNTVTFTAPEGASITKIVFTMNGTYKLTSFTADTGAVDTATFTWTGSANTVTLTNGSSSQTRFEAAAVTYETVDAGVPEHECADTNNDCVCDVYAECGKTAHTLTEPNVVDPTCTEDGYTIVECVNCDYEKKSDEEPAKGHVWADGFCSVCEIPMPTTLTIGRDSFDSTASGYAWHAWTATAATGESVSGKGYIYATEKTYIQVNAKTATNGNYFYNSDALPGKITSIKLTAGKATFRDFIVITSDTPFDSSTNRLTAPEGSSSQTVNDGGATWNFTTGHKYFAVIASDTGAAYLSSIEVTYAVCSHTNTEVIGEAKDATCTEDGITAGLKCSDCGEIITAQETIPATGHTDVDPVDSKCDTCGTNLCTEHKWVEGDAIIEGDCTTDRVVSQYCENCNEPGDNKTITAPGHTEVAGEAKAPTCTEAGHTAGSYCEVCGETITPQADEPATGHTFVNGTCSCGAVEQTYNKVTTEPTDWSGVYLIVNEENGVAFNGSLSELDAPLNTVDVTADGTIKGDFAANIFIITAVEGGYTIKSASGYYIGKTANSNGMNSSLDTAYVNTITIDADGNVIITGNAGPALRYNSASGQERFRYFKNTTYGDAIQLYKLDMAATTTDEPTATGMSATIGSSIGINVYYSIPKVYADMGATVYAVDADGNVLLKTPAVDNGKYTANVGPAYMDMKITFYVLFNGEKYAEKTVSVTDYLNKIKETYAADTDIYKLADAMLAYGAAAKNIEADNDLGINYNNGAPTYGVETNECDTIKLESIGGKLESTNTLSVGFFYNGTQALESLKIQVAIGEHVVQGNLVDYIPELAVGSNVLHITGIKAFDIGTDISITISDGVDTLAISNISLADYIAMVNEGDTATYSTALKNLAAALYNYYEAAAAYRASV